ncbi:hypothetical protein ACZ90_16105 [Streptomyces albus subsp. albus]|nr:hypothetical protein ACZ90_16105 [Streptomyces albus subsp. albus]
MRVPRPAAAAALAVALLTGAAVTVAVAQPQSTAERTGPGPATPRHRPETAACHTWTTGSRATAGCFNPYPRADRVRLHVECARWWDPDMDGTSVDVAPAQYVELSQRCWKEIRTAWVSHHPQ